jgi:hypothetical protein
LLCGRREHSELCDRLSMSKIPIKKTKAYKNVKLLIVNGLLLKC